ncbi:nuclear cap-binding protein subunit 1 [Drosophila eugracilis]|uniref:nuclear cap-binding protein subunit 1 n=1 Tax=Drosophila eugracilis TaxID=29029 RepID=UPI001BDAF099|nr:nuclear cap-binding protein subunit 1 [Drosophila eugracilis]
MEWGRRKRDDCSDDEFADYRRKRTAEIRLVTVDRLMVGLSFQSSSSIELKLENLWYLLRNNITAELKGHILTLLVTCVGEHPGQASAYATFVGLMNLLDYEFAAECVKVMMQNLYESMCTGEWSKCVGTVHFLVDLYNCKMVTADSLLKFLKNFIKECENQRDPEDVVDRGRRDWLAYCVLSALPLFGGEMEQVNGFDDLMLTLQIYIKKRYAAHTATLSIWRDFKQLDCLELLWQQVDDMRQVQWTEPEHQLISRPYLAFIDTLSRAQQHVLPSFQVAPHEPGCRYPPPRVSFRLFSYDASGEEYQVPYPMRIERHFLEVQVRDMLHSSHLDVRKCAASLLAYAVSKPQLTVYHCIVEVILGEMLQLPKSQWITINYGGILVALCKGQPDQVPQIIEQATDILFNRLDSMKVACFDRLVNWLSHHLSNFGYTWQWNRWCQSLPASMDSIQTNIEPKVVFLRELLKKCLRLSYHQKIVGIIPGIMARLLPPVCLPHLKFVDQSHPGATLSENLLAAMRNPQSCPKMISTIISGATDIGPMLKIGVFTQNCLHLKSKSFSHTFAILSKYESVFKELSAGNSDQQHTILDGVSEVWNDNEHFQFVVAEKLLKMELIEPLFLVSWLFGPQNHEKLTKMYIWEMLHSTVRHVKRVQKNKAPDDLDSPDGKNNAVRTLLLDIVHRFLKVLSARAIGEGSTENYWFSWVLGRLEETLFIYADDFKKMSDKLIKILKESDLKSEILKTVYAFLALDM